VILNVECKQIISVLEDLPTEDWLGILLIRKNEKLHYCLKSPLLWKVHADNCVRPSPDAKDCMDFESYIEREFLSCALSSKFELLPINFKSTEQHFSVKLVEFGTL
jgi:hypothetical protein